jgi:hypothetical protein
MLDLNYITLGVLVSSFYKITSLVPTCCQTTIKIELEMRKGGQAFKVAGGRVLRVGDSEIE